MVGLAPVLVAGVSGVDRDLAPEIEHLLAQGGPERQPARYLRAIVEGLELSGGKRSDYSLTQIFFVDSLPMPVENL